MKCETCLLDDQFLYPLYSPDEQRHRYQLGQITHKLPQDMNRHERRAASKIQHMWCGEHKERDNA